MVIRAGWKGCRQEEMGVCVRVRVCLVVEESHEGTTPSVGGSHERKSILVLKT